MIEDGSESAKEPRLNCAVPQVGQDIDSSVKRTGDYSEHRANGTSHHYVAREKRGAARKIGYTSAIAL